MRHLIINQNISNIENTQNSLIEYIYNLTKNKVFDDDELSGNISVQHAYADAIDYLMNRYRNLHITATRGEYVRFVDPVVANYYANTYGDGEGITTQQAQSVSQIPSFENNTQIVNFNDLRHFPSSTSILANSFKGTSSLTDIDLVNVQDIGNSAFQNSNIIRLNNHQYVKGPIGINCFKDAYNLSGNLNFENAVNWNAVQEYTFDYCKDITGITFPSSITEIKNYAFRGCRNLKTISGIDNITKIGYHAFNGCALEGIIYFPNCETVLFDAFNTANEFINAPAEGDTNPTHDQIGNKFQITKLIFPKLTCIESNSFRVGSALTEIDMPLVETIVGGAFQDTGLVNVSFTELLTLGNSTFKNCQSLTTVSIPNCTKIEYRNFENCTSLETINMSSCTSLGDNVFYNCTSLKTVNDISNVTSFGHSVFNNCISLTSIGNFNDSLLKISTGNIFYNCKSLETIDLNNIQILEGSSIFYGCTNLVTVLSNNLTNISGQSNFRECPSLKNIDLSNILTIGNYSFYKCSSLESIDLSSCTSIGISAFAECTSLTNITGLKGNLTENQIFYNCRSLTTLDLSNVQRITGSGVFSGCKNLANITNTSNLQALGYETFKGLTQLTTIDISNVTEMGTGCFMDCSNLTSITNNNTITFASAPHALFNGCPKLVLPSAITITAPFVGFRAFVDKMSITKVILSSNTKMLYNEAFENCNNITEIQGLENITHIGSWVFYHCDNLEGTISLPNLEGIVPNDRIYNTGQGGTEGIFCYCTKITKIILGHIPYINHNEYRTECLPFIGLTSLHTVDINSMDSILIGHNQFFFGCPNMTNFVLRNESVISIDVCSHIKGGSNHLAWSYIMSNANGKIFVPDNLVNNYKTTKYWEDISDYIFPLSEYVPIED